MPVRFTPEIQSWLLNIVVVTVLFFVVYCVLYKVNPSNFANATSLVDVWYFTMSTQSTVGYGDIVPTSKLAKILVTVHQFLIVCLAIQFIFVFHPLLHGHGRGRNKKSRN